MTVDELLRILLSLVPYLNAGTIALIIKLALERLDFKVTRRDFKREPIKSLLLGLGLIFISSIVALIIQTRLSGYEPSLVFIGLFIVYLALTQI